MIIPDRRLATVLIMLGVMFACAGIMTLGAGLVSAANVFNLVNVPTQLYAALPLANICAGLAFFAVPLAIYLLLPDLTNDEDKQA